MLRHLFLLFVILNIVSAAKAQNFWSDIAERDIPAGTGERRIVPLHYRTIQLDLNALETLLASAPERFTAAAEGNAVLIDLPLPGGGQARFRLCESPMMAPALQARYPEIRCYTGISLDDPGTTLKCDLTPWGFHAMVLSPALGTLFIDPYRHGVREYGVVYFKKDYVSKKAGEFTCSVENSPLDFDNKVGGDAPEMQGDCQMRRYRLALACTGEYAAFHGGTKPLVMAAMNTSMNRVNGVYEREVGVTMQLIPNNDTLINLVAASDPYTNDDGGTMLGQNVTACNARVGSANYDIGHVFSTGGGGVANLACVCGTSKARGVTGSSSPIGDGFDIDYVAHEMGHQFGGDHCFNNDCSGNINPSTAMETGSGSTIMGYAGVCNPNVQNHSDDYFHAISLQEIGTFTVGGGNGCSVKINVNNAAPTVNAGADYTIPKSTPFALKATGSDPNGDALTYCWEQMDPESGTQPPVSTSTVGPMFRSYNPVTSPTRYFPNLQDLVQNVNSTWEELPSVARNMKFRVTVRDNHAGKGCTEEDDMVVSVSGTAGPFVVNTPNAAGITWHVGESQAVTWSVASTNLAPINCAQVRILLSIDGGFTYPITLANSVPNNGSANVNVPNNLSTTCRVMVQSIGNVFFDISNQNFTIAEPPVPTFTLDATPKSAQACAGDAVEYALNTASILGFITPASLSVSGAPAGATLAFSPNPVTPGNNTTLSVGGLTPAMAGNYTLTVTATAGAVTRTATLTLDVLPGVPGSAVLSAPGQSATQQILSPTLSWAATPFTASYLVEVADNPSFAPASIVYTTTTANTSTTVSPSLQPTTVYYWRVRGSNACGDGMYSPVFAFQTNKFDCGHNLASTNVPIAISASSENTVTSTLTIPAGAAIISDLNINLAVTHSYVGDLRASLKGPGGQTVQLFDQPGVPASNFGCSGNNLVLTLDDEAAQTNADLESSCGNNPAISGSYQAVDALSAFDGQSASGTWTLTIDDTYDEDGGSLTGWSLDLCYPATLTAASLSKNEVLTIVRATGGTVDADHLTADFSGTAAQAVFTLLTIPQHGILTLDGITLQVGEAFTQADIDAGLVEYEHNGDLATADDFSFDFVDQNNSAWYASGVFDIEILQYTLAASAQAVATVICHNGETGAIEVTASGYNDVFTYSLNGGPEQSDPLFENLGPGTYTIVVTDIFGLTTIAGPITFSNPPALVVNATVTDNDLTAIASAGTGAPIDHYSVSGPANLQQADGNFQNLPNGIYTVTATDENGCTATTSATVHYSDLAASLAVLGPVTCVSQGSVQATAVAGYPPYTYSLNGGGYQPGSTFSGLAAGTYTVTAKDNQGFTFTTNSVTLTAPPSVSLSASAGTDTITAGVTGGTGPFAYSLDGQIFQPGNVFTGVANGVYTVTVRDEYGCTATDQVIVAVNSLLSTLEVASNIHCFGGNDGSITTDVAGGKTPYEYSLDGGMNYQASATFSGLSAGNYTVTVRDADGFTSTTNGITLSEPDLLEASASAAFNAITVNASGGTGALAYSLDGQHFQAENVFEYLANGAYTVTVRDANGCTATAAASIEVPPLELSVEVVDPAPNPCAISTSLVLTATPQGGIPPYQYRLNGGDWQTDSIFAGLSPGSFIVDVQDVTDSIFTQTITVVAPTLVSVSATTTGDELNIEPAGGTLPYTIMVNGAPVNELVLTDLYPGPYGILVVDGNGCTALDSVYVTGINTLEMSLAASGGIACNGGADGRLAFCVEGGYGNLSVELSPAVGNLSFDSSGVCSVNAVFSDLPAGDYTVLVTDEFGFSTTASGSIADAPLLLVNAQVVDDTIFGMGTGGTGPLEYSIDGGTNFQSSPVFPDLANGFYTLTVRDSNGCAANLEDIQVMFVGTLEPGAVWGAAISPNPGSGLFHLSLLNAPQEALGVEVFDAKGARLHSLDFKLDGGRFATEIDLSAQPDGVYFLRLTDGLRSGAMRVVKEN